MKFLVVLVALLGVSVAAPRKADSPLLEDLKELIDLLDVEDLIKTVDEHVATDPAVEADLIYLQSDDWENLVQEVLAIDAAQDFVKYLDDKGIPVEDIITGIRDWIASGKPGDNPDDTASLTSFFDDLGSFVDTAKLLDWVNNKLQSDEAVQDLYVEVASEDGFALVEQVRRIPEVRRIADVLRGQDIDIDQILQLVYEFLGWKWEPLPDDKKIVKAAEDSPLLEDLKELIDLLDVEDLIKTVDEHVASDPAVEADLIYLQSDDWESLVQEVLAIDAAQDFVKYLDDKGIPVEDIITGIRDWIANGKPGDNPDDTASLTSFFDDLGSFVDTAKLLDWVNNKLQSDEAVQDLYVEVASEDGFALVEQVRRIPEVRRIADVLRGQDIDIDQILQLVYEFLGWKWEPLPDDKKIVKAAEDSPLLEDLKELIDLLDVEDLIKTVDEHVASDPAVEADLIYLQSDDWESLVQEVLAIDAAQDFVKYLDDKGIPVEDIITGIRDWIASGKPGDNPDDTASLTSFFDDLGSFVDTAKLLDWVNNKLQSDEAVQDLYVEVASEDGFALVEQVRRIPEVRRIADVLRGQDIDIDQILQLVYEFLGWKWEPLPDDKKIVKAAEDSPLLEDLKELIDLLDVEDLIKTVDEHVASDPAVEADLIYLQSDDWESLVQEVLAIDAAQDFVKYLDDKGIPVEDIITGIRDWIASGKPGDNPDDTASLTSFFDDLGSFVDTAKLLDWVNNKLQSDEAVQDLYVEVASEDGFALVEQVRRIPEVRRIADVLRGQDIDIDQILQLVYEFLGWKWEPLPDDKKIVKAAEDSPLLEDLKELIDLLDVEDLIKTVDEHVASDPAVEADLIYLQSDDWENLVQEVLAIDAAQDFVKYLDDKGIPVEDIITGIRDWIASGKPGDNPDDTASLTSFFDDLGSFVDTAKLLAWVNNKLQSDEAVQDLYVEVASEDGFALVEQVRRIPEVRRIADVLRGQDIDIDQILQLVYEFLGWKWEPLPDDGEKTRLIGGLLGDLIELIGIVDVDGVIDDWNKHFESDGALAYVINYLQSDDFSNLIDEVKGLDGYKELINYLNEQGIPTDLVLGLISEAINNAKPGAAPVEDGDLTSFLDDLEGDLNLDKISSWLNDKLQSDKPIQGLYKELSSDAIHEFIEQIRKIDEVQNVAEHLRTMGVDVDGDLAALYDFLGWGKP